MPRASTPRSRRLAPRRRSGRGWFWLLILLILGAGAGGGWYWFHGRRMDAPVRREPVVTPPPVHRVPPSIPVQPPAVTPVTPRVEPVEKKGPPAIVPPSPATNVIREPVIPVEPASFVPRPAVDMVEVQIALEQAGFGTGPLDGVGGYQTSLALKAFQYQCGLEETGRRDRDTDQALLLQRAPLTRYEVRAEDLSRLHPIPDTWLGKSEVPWMDYESLVELVAEKSHAHPSLIRRLNPGVNWGSVAPGTGLIVPDAAYPAPRRAALVRISLAGRYLRAYDEWGNLLVHFPVSIGRVAEKRPVGALSVIVAVKDPNYTFDPAVFPESEEGRRIGRRLVIPPGPNNPVGLAWIGLNRPGYGIHGTPVPEQVGRTESHGCFRLANWNVEHLRQMVAVGTPVRVEK